MEQFINKIINDNCIDVFDKLQKESIDLVVTSPPYDNLRDYKGYTFKCKEIADGLLKVMKPGGVVVWVVGDAVIKGSETGTSFRQAITFQDAGFNIHDTMIYEKNTSAFPARRDGKRYTQIFEYMFIFSKGTPKTVNLICDKPNRWVGWVNWGKNTKRGKDGKLKEVNDIKPVEAFSPRNNLWRYINDKTKEEEVLRYIPVKESEEEWSEIRRYVVGGNYGQKDKSAYKHPATFPEQLVVDHILTWSNEGDLVLDPMCGSGTTCMVAQHMKRNFIGIEISKEYCEIAHQRAS